MLLPLVSNSVLTKKSCVVRNTRTLVLNVNVRETISPFNGKEDGKSMSMLVWFAWNRRAGPRSIGTVIDVIGVACAALASRINGRMCRAFTDLSFRKIQTILTVVHA